MSNLISAKSKTEMVVENVIQTIATEDYKSGDKLPPESYFMSEYDVSRVTIREAFKRLSSLGVVTIKSGDGTFVNEIKPFEIKEALLPLLTINNNSIEEIYETRICTELYIVELAVLRRTDDDLVELSQLINLMEESLKNNDIDNYSIYDDQFHNYLSDICGNHLLASIYESLKLVRRTNIARSNLSDKNLMISMQEHHDIFHSIETQDVEVAKYILRRHLLRSKSNVIEELMRAR